MQLALAITLAAAGAIGFILAAWHGWKARRRPQPTQGTRP